MNRLNICFVLLLLIAFSCGPQSEQSTEKPQERGVIAENGMVVSAHPLASQVGVDVLKKGGNAVDAAIAVQFALAVVYPTAGNIGGGGFMVIRNNDGSTDALDFREMAASAASRDMYIGGDSIPVEGLSTRGHLAAGVPGSVDGMFVAHERYGSLAMEELIQPSIDIAANGFLLTAREARMLTGQQENFEKYNSVLPEFLMKEKWNEGDSIYYKDLAGTLERVRDNGRAGFYEGETADLIVAEMQRGNGIITHEDLINYKSVWREPIITQYRGHKIISMSPPSSGGIALAQLLKLVEPFDLGSMGPNTAQSAHLMAEAERRVFADRATHLGDPDYYQVPVSNLLDEEYLKSRFENYNPERATNSDEILAGDFTIAESMETTHFSVVDAQGNAVSVTTTLNGGYGSKVVVAGAGFILNNEMDDFSIKPGFPNMYGLVGGEANAIEAGKRMLSSMTPTIVEKDGKLLMVVGTPGGSTIITSVFQAIVNVIDHGLTMQEAVSAGRFHNQWRPDMIMYHENAFDSATIQRLQDMGHNLRERNGYGKLDCILVLEDGRLEGGADPRGDDAAVGY